MNESLVLLIFIFSTFLVSSHGGNYYQLLQGKDTTRGNIDKTVFKRTRRQQQPSRTNSTQDNHLYYTSRFIPPGRESDSLWFELSDIEGSGDIVTNISEAAIQDYFRYYQIWRLKFNFPFYGHLLDTVAVTTGGFLYTGTFFHDQIHLTQFIAPLLANFNPSLNDTAKIYVYSTEKRFIVQWNEVHNNDHVDDGPFSFQVSMFPNGTMYFVYKEIPLPTNRISNDDHPVVVGLADSFYVDLTEGIFLVRYIYEYSRIILNSTQELSNSAYIINPVKNCIFASSCDQCASITTEGNFDCKWCPDLQRCSDGIDRHRQSWFDSGCINDAISSCPTTSTTQPTGQKLSVGASVGISFFVLVMVIVLVVGTMVVIVLIYSYKRPTSRFGKAVSETWRHKKVNSQTAVYETDGGEVAILDDTDDVEQS